MTQWTSSSILSTISPCSEASAGMPKDWLISAKIGTVVIGDYGRGFSFPLSVSVSRWRRAKLNMILISSPSMAKTTATMNTSAMFMACAVSLVGSARQVAQARMEGSTFILEHANVLALHRGEPDAIDEKPDGQGAAE